MICWPSMATSNVELAPSVRMIAMLLLPLDGPSYCCQTNVKPPPQQTKAAQRAAIVANRVPFGCSCRAVEPIIPVA